MQKIILNTGASSRFGFLTANLLHEKGYEVYSTSRNPSRHQMNFELLKMDVQNSTEIRNVVEHIIEENGGIDVLVNNAGMLLYGALEEASEEEIQLI